MMVLAAETKSRTSLLRLKQRERKANKSSQCACGSFAHDPKTQSHSNFLMTHFYGVERACVWVRQYLITACSKQYWCYVS